MEMSLSGLADVLARAAADVRIESELAVVAVAKEIQAGAKEKIGHYQPESHGFTEWAPLTEATQDSRSKQGYTPNDPLDRSGELRDSIDMRAEGNGAIVGTPLEKGLWMENGTETIPPRPYLGPAAAEKAEKIGEIMLPHLHRAFRK